MSESVESEYGEIEDLLANSRWISGLARRLILDSGLAEDVIQDAYVVALENRARIRGRMSGFVAGVIRKLASSSRRGAARRSERELAAARPDDGRDDVDVSTSVANVELQKRLADALLALREPYRRALLLRFVEDLPQREIARRLGVPLATVNSQITRGLAILRETLARDGDATPWLSAALPLALGGSGSPIVHFVVLGVRIMSLKQRITVAAAAAAILLTSACFLFAPREDAETKAVASRRELAVAAAPEAAIPEPASGSNANPTSVRKAVEAANDADIDSVDIAVRVMSESDRTPVAGIRVELASQLDSKTLRDSNHSAFEMLGGLAPSFGERWDAVGERHVTDADGWVVLKAPTGLSLGISAYDGRQFGSVRVRPGVLKAELIVAPMVVADVDVVDASGSSVAGVPIALAAVSSGRNPNPYLVVVSDANGRASLPISPCLDLISGTKDDLIVRIELPLGSAPQRVISRRGEHVRLVLPPTASLVVDVESDVPLPERSMVILAAPSSPEGIAPPFCASFVDHGVARFPFIGPGLSLAAIVVRPLDPFSSPRAEDRVATSPVPGAVSHAMLRFDARRYVSFRGRLMKGDSPWGGALTRMGFGAKLQTLVRGEADGTFEQRLVLPDDPGGETVLEIRESSTQAVAKIPFDRANAQKSGIVDLGDCALARPRMGAGVVRDDRGHPVAGVTVYLSRRTESEGVPWEPIEGAGHATTDDRGRFELLGSPPTGDAFIAVRATSMALLGTPVPYRCADDLEIVVPSRFGLEGRLSLDVGIPGESVHLAVRRENGDSPPALVKGSWLQMTVEKDGSFRREDLAPGSYTLAIGLSRIDDAPLLIEGIDVGSGAAPDPRVHPLDLRGRYRTLDLDVRDEVGNALHGFAIARLPDRTSRQLGDTSRLLILRRDERLATVIVSAEGFASESLGSLEGREGTIPVVLKHDMVVELEWPDPSALPPPPVTISAALAEVGKSDGRSTSSSDDPMFDADGIVRLRVPRAGNYYLSVTVTRVDGRVGHWAFVTDREKCPVVTVPPAGADGIPRIRIPLEADAATKALTRLN